MHQTALPQKSVWFFTPKPRFFPLKAEIWVCLKIAYPYTQWFCWSLSLLNCYFIGNIPHFQTNPYLVGGLEHFLFFHSVGNDNRNWRTHIFQRGWNHQPDIVGVIWPICLGPTVIKWWCVNFIISTCHVTAFKPYQMHPNAIENWNQITQFHTNLNLKWNFYYSSS